MNIDKQDKLIWKHTHSDFKGTQNGKRTIMVNRNGGSTIVPIELLTEEERASCLKYALHKENEWPFNRQK
jgi:hypothetical protein